MSRELYMCTYRFRGGKVLVDCQLIVWVEVEHLDLNSVTLHLYSCIS